MLIHFTGLKKKCEKWVSVISPSYLLSGMFPFSPFNVYYFKFSDSFSSNDIDQEFIKFRKYILINISKIHNII